MDGQNPALFEGELQAGETRTWKAKDLMDMRVGNAGGVEVTVNGMRQGKLGAGEGSRRITPDEVAELTGLIEQSGLFGLPPSIGRPNPDGYAYELIARLGRRSKASAAR